ncbi:hypothetical protein L1987_32950 [Smallanthus sonchifolius]|uniref:Uncharacterized protein n=1 Tax=Smallanthus sonchifolius TaxID=185202 RepID=A0ACB9HPZ5_9ASTR|nr:hypothetical protein L1987_32950 [Smallanthus sonchifolius]
MNNALMAAHIWSLLTRRESLWVKWMHAYRIRDRNFWDIPLRNVTWSWRKLLTIRPIVQHHIWTKLGDGTLTSAWFDKWDEFCPLSSFITPRVIANAGFRMTSKVADMCDHGMWVWPNEWVNRYPVLQNMHNIVLNPLSKDRLVWRSRSGKETEYSASIVWDDIRSVQNEVPWADMVWFPQSIPRHSFFMWLLVNKKLKTQDIMCRWYTSGNTNFNLLCCSLCTSGPDSHKHLFFECFYGTQVWNGVKGRAGMETVRNTWDSISDHLVRFAKSKNEKHVIGKLVVGAAAYFVWQERNLRLFSTKKRSADRLVEVILATVRMKLHTMRFKRTSQVERILQDWSLPRGLLIEDDDCG